MKKIVLLFFVFVSLLFSFEKVEGFREIKLGDLLQTFNNATLKEESKELRTASYVKKNDYLQIGDNKLIGITYLFFQDKLFEIQIKCAREGCENIKELFEQKYGKFRLTQPFLPVHSGDINENYITKNFPQRPDFSTEEGIFFITSGKIKKEIEKQMKSISVPEDSTRELIKSTQEFSLKGIKDL